MAPTDAPPPDRKALIEIEAAAADLLAKQLANEKARQELATTRTTALKDALTASVPDLAATASPAVGFTQGATMRQGEATALALADAAGQVARAVATAVGSPAEGEAVRVHVTSDPNLLAAVVRYRQLVAEATLLRSALEAAAGGAQDALAPPETLVELDREFLDAGSSWSGEGIDLEVDLGAPIGGITGAALLPALGPTALVAGPLLGEAAAQAAALLEYEVDVRGERADVPARSVHAAVIAALLRSEVRLEVVHESIGTPSADSALLGLVTDLVRLDQELVRPALDLDAAVGALGDPAADLTAARKARDAAAEGSPERTEAEGRIRDATERAARVVILTGARTAVQAAVTKAAAFVERVARTPDGGGASPLAAAVTVEPLAGGSTLVLVVGGASAESSQVMVTRRLAAPRLQTATTAEVDWFLVRGPVMVAAGRAGGSVSFHGRIDRKGATWLRVPALASAPAQPSV